MAVNLTRTPLTMFSIKEISTSSSSFSFPQFPHNRKFFPNPSSSSTLPSLQSTNVSLELANNNTNLNFPIMVNGCTGKMGRAVIEAAGKVGIRVILISFGGEEDAGQVVEFGGTNFHVHGPAEREGVLASVFDAHPDVIVIDYTVPDAVNVNAELYSRVGVPFVMGTFVMGTTGGDREKLHKTVDDANILNLIGLCLGLLPPFEVISFLISKGSSLLLCDYFVTLREMLLGIRH